MDATNLVETQVAPIIRDENGYPVPNPDPRRLKEVQDFELAIAGVDFTCTENQFVAEHKAELERWRDRASEFDLLLGLET